MSAEQGRANAPSGLNQLLAFPPWFCVSPAWPFLSQNNPNLQQILLPGPATPVPRHGAMNESIPKAKRR